MSGASGKAGFWRRQVRCFVPNRRVRPALAMVTIGIAALGNTARAEAPSVLAFRDPAMFGRPIGGSFPGGHVGGGPTGGPLLGVEGGWATTLAAGKDPSEGSASFGARAGWAFP